MPRQRKKKYEEQQEQGEEKNEKKTRRRRRRRRRRGGRGGVGVDKQMVVDQKQVNGRGNNDAQKSTALERVKKRRLRSNRKDKTERN